LEMALSELRRITQITAHTPKFWRQQTLRAATSIPDRFESALLLFKNSLFTARIAVEGGCGGVEPTCRDKVMEPMFTTKGIGAPGWGCRLMRKSSSGMVDRLTFSTQSNGMVTGTRFGFFLPYEPAETLYLARDTFALSRGKAGL
jgi:hypothetical protein